MSRNRSSWLWLDAMSACKRRVSTCGADIFPSIEGSGHLVFVAYSSQKLEIFGYKQDNKREKRPEVSSLQGVSSGLKI